MRRIVFFAILSLILFIITSVLLLIWWPTKASLSQVTNSWVALILIYLILVIFLFEKPIYKFYNDFFDIKRPGRHESQKLRQKEIPDYFSKFDFKPLVSYRDLEWDDILKREERGMDSSVIEDEKLMKYIQKLQDENIKWRFIYADNYLVLYTKYVLFWLFKSEIVDLEDFNEMWKPKIREEQERNAILDALQKVEFVRIENENLFITDLGRAYVNYLKELDKHSIQS